MIKKARYTLHRIPNHNKPPQYLLIKRHDNPITLRIMRLDRDNILASPIVVPVVPRPEAGEGLDEVPRHAGAAAGVGCRVGDCDAGGWFFGPGYFASSVGEGDGEATMVVACGRLLLELGDVVHGQW